MRVIAIMAGLAALCLPAAATAAGGHVRHQQGRVLTDSDRNESAAKLPGTHKVGDVTLKRGIISRDAAIAQREDIKPLTEKLATGGLRNSEAEYAEELRHWAKRQRTRLLKLQKIHSAYDRLKEYRDDAAALGDGTSRIDPRLESLEKKLRKASDEIWLAYDELGALIERNQARIKHMSNLMEARQDTARAIIRNTHS